MDKVSLNIGCGENPIEGFINIDCIENEMVKPDLVLDIINQKLPCEDSTVDEIWMIHSLEHIEMHKWQFILEEFRRVLKDNGTVVFSYPEFKECAKNFLNNHGNKKTFWRATLYGRQLYKSDYHVVPMDSNEIKEILEIAGFYRVNHRPESDNEPYNTIMVGYKDPKPVSREAVLVKELHLSIGDTVMIGDLI